MEAISMWKGQQAAVGKSNYLHIFQAGHRANKSPDAMVRLSAGLCPQVTSDADLG